MAGGPADGPVLTRRGAGQVDAFATRPHYLAHVLPVWEALPPERRGVLATGRAADRARLAHRPDALLLAAGQPDLNWLPGRRWALMEHGAGQSYGGDPSMARRAEYAGGDGRHGVAVFLHPNGMSAARDAARYPDSRSAVVGSPLLERMRGWVTAGPPPARPVLAFTFHWDYVGCPETRCGWPIFRSAVVAARASGLFSEVLVSMHPRAFRAYEQSIRRAGGVPVASFEELVARAHVLAADNTTALYHFAALAGPVVVLDHPTYRRDVHHGLRFWTHADVGPRTDDPRAVPALAAEALAAGPWPGAGRLLGEAWAEPAGGPAAAAAEALVAAVDDPPDVGPRGRR